MSWMPARKAKSTQPSGNLSSCAPAHSLSASTRFLSLNQRDQIVALAVSPRGAGNLRSARVRHRWRPDELSNSIVPTPFVKSASMPARPPRRETADLPVHELARVEFCHQPQDRQDTRPHLPDHVALPRRWGDRISAPAASWCDRPGVSPPTQLTLWSAW